MKKTKIIITILLVILLAACCLAGCEDKNSEPGEKPFVIGIISDPQIVAASDVGDDDYASFQDFNAIGQKMLFISEAILKTAVDRLIEEKVNVVLIPGDLTENGSKAGHEMVATQCARLEAAGIPTYVICGNHDINKDPERYMLTADAKAQGLPIYEEFSDGTCSVSVSGVSQSDFMEIFYEYGFKDAIALDTLETPVSVNVKGYTYEEIGTMSYVQDLPGSDYRLIAIDASNYNEDENEHTYYMTEYGRYGDTDIKGTGYPVMTKRLLNWIETQLKAAQAAGKKPIAMAHFPINNQMGDVVGMLTDGIDNRMNMVEDLLDILAKYHVEYVFTGHLHTQHTATYTDDYYETTVTDVETGCLTNYPLPIRYVSFGKKGVSIRNEYLATVKEEYLPSYLDSATIKQAVLTDLQSYALDPFIYDNLLYNFDRRINDDDEEYALFYKIFDMLDLDPDDEHEEELASLADYIYNDLYMAFMKMPLYTKDKGANDKFSLEEICQKYNVTLPASNYKSVFQFFIQLLGKFYKYDYESDGGPITYEGTEGTILRYGVYSIFEYIRSSELFTRLHAINADIVGQVISERFVQKLYSDGTIDLLCDGFIIKVLTVLKPLLSDLPIEIKFDNAEGLVKNLKNLLPIGLEYIADDLPGIYDEEDETVFGVPLTSILKVEMVKNGEEDVPVFEIYFDTILKDIVFDKVGKGVLN